MVIKSAFGDVVQLYGHSIVRILTHLFLLLGSDQICKLLYFCHVPFSKNELRIGIQQTYECVRNHGFKSLDALLFVHKGFRQLVVGLMQDGTRRISQDEVTKTRFFRWVYIL